MIGPLTQQEVLRIGKETLSTEAHAIQRAQNALGEDFCTALGLLFHAKGKIVLTGLGKSGYVAQKLASTFSSTGTSAFYLHPAEALHGDFGMLSKGDVLIAITYGGESREVLIVSKFAKSLHIPTIAITGSLKSKLAKICDVCLDASVDKEADALGLAPTSSSTVAMALGDSLCVALMHMKEFTAEQFAKLHPGGNLGRKLAKVYQLMKPLEDIICLKSNDSFFDVLKALNSNNFGIVAVIDDFQKLVGVITDGDIRRVLLEERKSPSHLLCKDFMSHKPKTIEFSSQALDAVSLMEHHKITSVIVLEGTKICGLIRLHDLIKENIL